MAIELVKPSTAPAAPAPVAGEAGVIAAGVYAGGRRIRDIPIEEAGQWFKRPGHVVWIGLYEPSGELLRRVQKQFDLHEMAIEDAEQAHQRPKIEQYGEALFIVARTAQLEKGRIAFGETHLFVGRGYIVSVRHGASTSYSTVRQHLEACPIVLANGEDYILYGILDFIVDNYMPVIEAVHAEIDEIEDKVFSAALDEKAIERLYMLRRDLLRLRNAALPLMEVCRGWNTPRRGGSTSFDAAALPRRDRPCPPRAGGDRFAPRGARLRFRGEPDDRPGAAGAHHPPPRRLGRHPGRADGGRRHLRHEFRVHARA